MKVSIRPDHCIALRLIAAQEHYRKSQDWLNMVPEWERLVEVAGQSQAIIKMQAAEILRLRAENEKLREENEKLVAQSWVVDGALLSEREEIAKLRAALIDTLASLVASVDLLERGGKKAAPSNKMFEQMLVDYKNSIERGRAAAAALKETGNE